MMMKSIQQQQKRFMIIMKSNCTTSRRQQEQNRVNRIILQYFQNQIQFQIQLQLQIKLHLLLQNQSTLKKIHINNHYNFYSYCSHYPKRSICQWPLHATSNSCRSITCNSNDYYYYYQQHHHHQHYNKNNKNMYKRNFHSIIDIGHKRTITTIGSVDNDDNNNNDNITHSRISISSNSNSNSEMNNNWIDSENHTNNFETTNDIQNTFTQLEEWIDFTKGILQMDPMDSHLNTNTNTNTHTTTNSTTDKRDMNYSIIQTPSDVNDAEQCIYYWIRQSEEYSNQLQALLISKTNGTIIKNKKTKKQINILLQRSIFCLQTSIQLYNQLLYIVQCNPYKLLKQFGSLENESLYYYNTNTDTFDNNEQNPYYGSKHFFIGNYPRSLRILNTILHTWSIVYQYQYTNTTSNNSNNGNNTNSSNTSTATDTPTVNIVDFSILLKDCIDNDTSFSLSNKNHDLVESSTDFRKLQPVVPLSTTYHLLTPIEMYSFLQNHILQLPSNVIDLLLLLESEQQQQQQQQQQTEQEKAPSKKSQDEILKEDEEKKTKIKIRNLEKQLLPKMDVKSYSIIMSTANNTIRTIIRDKNDQIVISTIEKEYRSTIPLFCEQLFNDMLHQSVSIYEEEQADLVQVQVQEQDDEQHYDTKYFENNIDILRPDTISCIITIQSWKNSLRNDTFIRVQELFNDIIQLYKEGYINDKPTIELYNTYIQALVSSSTITRTHIETAESIVMNEMSLLNTNNNNTDDTTTNLLRTGTNFNIVPNDFTYQILIMAWSNLKSPLSTTTTTTNTVKTNNYTDTVQSKYNNIHHAFTLIQQYCNKKHFYNILQQKNDITTTIEDETNNDTISSPDTTAAGTSSLPYFDDNDNKYVIIDFSIFSKLINELVRDTDRTYAAANSNTGRSNKHKKYNKTKNRFLDTPMQADVENNRNFPQQDDYNNNNDNNELNYWECQSYELAEDIYNYMNKLQTHTGLDRYKPDVKTYRALLILYSKTYRPHNAYKILCQLDDVTYTNHQTTTSVNTFYNDSTTIDCTNKTDELIFDTDTTTTTTAPLLMLKGSHYRDVLESYYKYYYKNTKSSNTEQLQEEQSATGRNNADNGNNGDNGTVVITRMIDIISRMIRSSALTIQPSSSSSSSSTTTATIDETLLPNRMKIDLILELCTNQLDYVQAETLLLLLISESQRCNLPQILPTKQHFHRVMKCLLHSMTTVSPTMIKNNTKSESSTGNGNSTDSANSLNMSPEEFAERIESLIHVMQQLPDNEYNDNQPSLLHYSILVDAWGKCQRFDKCWQVFEAVLQLDNNDIKSSSTNNTTLSTTNRIGNDSTASKIDDTYESAQTFIVAMFHAFSRCCNGDGAIQLVNLLNDSNQSNSQHNLPVVLSVQTNTLMINVAFKALLRQGTFIKNDEADVAGISIAQKAWELYQQQMTTENVNKRHTIPADSRTYDTLIQIMNQRRRNLVESNASIPSKMQSRRRSKRHSDYEENTIEQLPYNDEIIDEILHYLTTKLESAEVNHADKYMNENNNINYNPSDDRRDQQSYRKIGDGNNRTKGSSKWTTIRPGWVT